MSRVKVPGFISGQGWGSLGVGAGGGKNSLLTNLSEREEA